MRCLYAQEVLQHLVLHTEIQSHHHPIFLLIHEKRELMFRLFSQVFIFEVRCFPQIRPIEAFHMSQTHVTEPLAKYTNIKADYQVTSHYVLYKQNCNLICSKDATQHGPVDFL